VTVLLFVVIMVVVSGLVAAAGDRMGHRAARAKIRIGKLRPRTASTLIAVATGVLISLLSFVLVFAISSSFRDALLRFDKIKAEAQELLKEKKQRAAELSQAQADISKMQAQTTELVKQIDLTTKELTAAGADKAKIKRELSGLIAKSDTLKLEIVKKQKDLKLQEFNVKSLEGVQEKLKQDVDAYESKLTTYMQGDVVIPRGMNLCYQVVHPGEAGQLPDLLQSALNRTTVSLSQSGLTLAQNAAERAQQFIDAYPYQDAKQDVVVVISASRNVFDGESVPLNFQAQLLEPLVHKGEVLLSVLVRQDSAIAAVLGNAGVTLEVPAQFDAASLGDFGVALDGKLSAAAREAGFLPDLKTGSIATPIVKLADVSNDLISRQRPFLIQFVASQDMTALEGMTAAEIYISNPQAE
jgi:uncharacterized protein (DUF3084 family)